MFWSTLYSPDVDIDLFGVTVRLRIGANDTVLDVVVDIVVNVDVYIEIDHCCQNRCFDIDVDFLYWHCRCCPC